MGNWLGASARNLRLPDNAAAALPNTNRARHLDGTLSPFRRRTEFAIGPSLLASRHNDWRLDILRLRWARATRWRIHVLYCDNEPRPISFFDDHRHQTKALRTHGAVGISIPFRSPTMANHRNLGPNKLQIGIENRPVSNRA